MLRNNNPGIRKSIAVALLLLGLCLAPDYFSALDGLINIIKTSVSAILIACSLKLMVRDCKGERFSWIGFLLEGKRENI